MAKAAFAYPLLARIVATPTAEIAGRKLTNTNQLLGAYGGADGVKTGTTDAAGECLVASVTRDDHRLLVIVLGSTDRYADARTLLDYSTAGWRWQSVGLADNALGLDDWIGRPALSSASDGAHGPLFCLRGSGPGPVRTPARRSRAVDRHSACGHTDSDPCRTTPWLGTTDRLAGPVM